MISIRPLKIMMIDRNINYSDLARDTGISTETIYRLKEGSPVCVSVYDRICKVYDCSISDIIEYTEGEEKR